MDVKFYNQKSEASGATVTTTDSDGNDVTVKATEAECKSFSDVVSGSANYEVNSDEANAIFTKVGAAPMSAMHVHVAVTVRVGTYAYGTYFTYVGKTVINAY